MSKNTGVKICYHITLPHPFPTYHLQGHVIFIVWAINGGIFAAVSAKLRVRERKCSHSFQCTLLAISNYWNYSNQFVFWAVFNSYLWTFILTTPSDQKVLLFTWLKALLLDLRFPVGFPTRSALTLQLVCYPLLSVLIIFCTFPTQPVVCLNRL